MKVGKKNSWEKKKISIGSLEKINFPIPYPALNRFAKSWFLHLLILSRELTNKMATKQIKESERNQEATVYIGNIDEEATEELIYELMIQAGPVVSINLPKDRVNQVHQGFGFVEFRTERDAEYASMTMNQIRLFGKPLRVNKALLDKQKAIDVGADLFIGNLDPMVDERTLHDTFAVFGNLTGVPKIVRDESGASKGFGFVSFDGFETSDRALEAMNGQYIMSKPIVVNYAFKRDGKGERHGDDAERLLAEQAKKNNYQLPVQPPAGAGGGQQQILQSEIPVAPQRMNNSIATSMPLSTGGGYYNGQQNRTQPHRSTSETPVGLPARPPIAPPGFRRPPPGVNR